MSHTTLSRDSIEKTIGNSSETKWACDFVDRDTVIGPFDNEDQAKMYAFSCCIAYAEKIEIYPFNFKAFGLENI